MSIHITFRILIGLFNLKYFNLSDYNLNVFIICRLIDLYTDAIFICKAALVVQVMYNTFTGFDM